MYPMTGECELHKEKGSSAKNKHKRMRYCLCLTKSSEEFLHTGSENKAVSRRPLCAEIFLGDSDEKVGSCKGVRVLLKG